MRPAPGSVRGLVALGMVLLAFTHPGYAQSAYADPTNPPPAPVSSKSLEQLQAEAAAIQAEFATATIAYTQTLRAAQIAQTAAIVAERNAAVAKSRAEDEHRKLGQVTVQAYQMGIPTTIGTESMLWSLASVAENLQEIADRQTAISVVGQNQVVRYNAAKAAEAAANAAAGEAAKKRNAADQAAVSARQQADEVQKKATAVADAMQSRLTELSAAMQVSDELQKARNAQALARWNIYLIELTTAGIKAPKAAALRDPAKLPTRLQPLKDKSGKTIAGTATVASGTRKVRVLPAEAINAVSAAFGMLGKPYGIDGTGPDDYDCLGAAKAAWWQGGATLPQSVRRTYGRFQKVPRSWVQYGDLIVVGDRTVGLHHIGIAIDNNEMIAADAAKGAVVVTSVPSSVYGVIRPALGRPSGDQVGPHRSRDAVEMRCGAPVDSIGTGGWTWPLPDGTFQIGAAFGQAGPLWASGVHTGQDFSAAAGTPVRSVAAGTAYVEHPGWAGNLVRIDHGNGLQTWYAHLKTVAVGNGQSVAGGQELGQVGQLGNATGPHLHFEVRLGGEPVNPMPFLATGELSLGWGGFSNGMIPLDRLCSAAVDHLLRCDAAAAYRSLAKAFEQRFGRRLCISDSYRSYADQVRLYAAKPSLAALPGTSNHGWGLAVDLCGGIQRFGTTEHQWMTTNAATHGWIHPRWAHAGGSRPEPWHWEYGKLSAD